MKNRVPHGYKREDSRVPSTEFKLAPFPQRVSYFLFMIFIIEQPDTLSTLFCVLNIKGPFSFLLFVLLAPLSIYYTSQAKT